MSIKASQNKYLKKKKLIDKLFELIKSNKSITKNFLNNRNQPLLQKRKMF